MIIGLLLLVSGSILLFTTERCRRNPETCKHGFMTEQGNTGSIVALSTYMGKASEARQAIVENRSLRNKYLLECYIKVLLCLIGGIFVTLYNF